MMQELVAAYNEEHQELITYYQMRDVIANERNIVCRLSTLMITADVKRVRTASFC